MSTTTMVEGIGGDHDNKTNQNDEYGGGSGDTNSGDGKI